MTGYTDLLNIMSLNDAPTTITGVLINRGNCRSKGTYDYQNMRYGSVAKVYLGCSAEYVREVTVTTNSGLASNHGLNTLSDEKVTGILNVCLSAAKQAQATLYILLT